MSSLKAAQFLGKNNLFFKSFLVYLYRIEREAQLAKETAERLVAAARKRKRASILNQKNRHKKKLV